jgi:hypothetical protein
MTQQEKHMNKQDLKNFKKGEQHIGAFIPGINNIQSVGAAPLARKGVLHPANTYYSPNIKSSKSGEIEYSSEKERLADSKSYC